MVGGLVQHQGIGTEQHHPGQHAPDLLAAGEDLNGLVHVVAGEQHPAQEGPLEGLGVGLRDLGGELRQPIHQIQIAVIEEGGVIQWEIAGGNGGAPLVGALVRLHLAHDDLEQGGLGDLILAYKGDLISLVHPEGHIVQHLAAVQRLGDALHRQDLLAALPLHGKAHEGIPPGGGGHFLYRQLVQQLTAGRGLLAFGLVGGEALDEQLQFLDLFLVFPVLVLHHPLDHLAGLVPELIVAHIHLDMAVVHVHDVGADGVQEVTVMAHHKDQALAVHQEVLKPLDSLNVQMVGRLVQQDDVRLAEQCLGQQHLHLFLGGQAGHFAVQNIVGEAKALNEPGHVGFGLPAAHFGKFSLQLAGLHAVLVGEVLFFIEGVLLLHHIVKPLVAHHHRIQHGVGVILEVVLLQNGHPLFLGNNDLAGGGLQIPGEDAEEGGLAGAVGADDAVAVAGNELQLHVLEQGLAAEVHAYIVDCDHVGILSSRSPRFSRRLLLLSVIAGQRSGRQTVPRRIKKRRPNGRHRTLCCPKLVLLCCFFSLLSSILLHLYRNILTFLETVNKVVNSPRR